MDCGGGETRATYDCMTAG